MQQLAADAKPLLHFPVHRRLPVFAIPHNGMADAGQMGPDLMGAPGDQMHQQQGEILCRCQRRIVGTDVGPALHRRLMNAHLIGSLVLDEIPVQGHGGFQLPGYDTKIFLADRPIL